MIDNASRWKVSDRLSRLIRDPEYQQFMRDNTDDSGVYHTSAALDDEPARDVVRRVFSHYKIGASGIRSSSRFSAKAPTGVWFSSGSSRRPLPIMSVCS
jgi:hypothetical protein